MKTMKRVFKFFHRMNPFKLRVKTAPQFIRIVIVQYYYITWIQILLCGLLVRIQCSTG